MEDPKNVRLGEFRLDGPLGSGGQGTVWSGHHEGSGIRVAVKVLTADGARKPRALQAFRREVRAAARLDHPNIVMVLDQGELPAPVASGSVVLAKGSPYLVMERAACSLGDLSRPLSWSRTKAVLTAVLDGLAHAHARGVLHRDVKPGNILFPQVPQSTDDFATACLADFGLAIDREQGVPADGIATAGSPLFMAPEQFTGDSAEIGVETDLYAVGWLGWWLATDQSFFEGDDIRGIRRRKIAGRLPAWPDSAVCPPEFERWVHRLLSTDPLERFPSAAAAKACLQTLEDDGTVSGSPVPFLTGSAHTDPTFDFLTMDGSDAGSRWNPRTPTGMHSDQTTAFLEPDEMDALALGDQHPVADVLQLEPLPEAFPTLSQARPWDLRGTGLALYGLRVPRPVGRDAVFEALWTDLRAVVDLGSPRHVLLHGPTGAGRSLVLDTFAWSTAATGAVSVLRLDPTEGPWALAGMLARFFGAARLHPIDRERRVSRRLRQLGVVDPVDVAGVVRLVADPGSSPQMPVGDLRGVLHVVLRALVARGPVLVLVDDAETFSPEAWGLFKNLAGPVLMVWSCRDDALRDGSPVRSFLDGLAPIGRSLQPLSKQAVRQSIQQTAGLDPTFARRLAELTEGNPGLTHQIITDLVARSALVLTTRGWSAPASSRLGGAGHETAWDLHLDRIESLQGPVASLALAAAAALGPTVELRTWGDVLDALEVELPDGMLDRWLDHGLIRSAPSGTSFQLAHPLLRRRALERSPRPAPQLHLQCARVLAAAKAPPGDIGEQLRLAGHHSAALPHLLAAIEQALDGTGAAPLPRLERAAGACIDALARPTDHPDAIRLAVLRGRIAVRYAAFSDALAHVSEVMDQRGLDDDLGRQARLVHVMGALGVMDLSTVGRVGPDLLETLEPRSPDHLKLRLVLGTAAAYSGQPATSRKWLEPAIDARASGLLQGRVRVQLATAHKAGGDTSTALAHIDAAVTIFERQGARRWLGQALNERGDIRRRRGELERAEADYVRAESLFRVLGTTHALGPRINLGYLAIARSDHAGAETLLRLALGVALGAGQRGYAYAAAYGLLAATAGRFDPDGFDAIVGQIRDLAARAHFADADLAESAEQAARIWRTRTDDRRARHAARLAHAMWAELGQTDRATRLRQDFPDLTVSGPAGGVVAASTDPPAPDAADRALSSPTPG